MSQGEPPGHDDYHRGVYDPVGAADRPGTHGRGLDLGLLLLRLGSLLLLPRGLSGARDMPALVREVAANPVGAVAPELLAWLGVLGQLGLPVLLAVGLFTRPAALLLAAMSATVWAVATLARLDYTVLADAGGLTGEAGLLYVALILPLVLTGAGRWSLDAMRTGGRP